MLIGKFSEVLKEEYIIRESESKDRVDGIFDILKIRLYEDTEFGKQGSFLCWYGKFQDDHPLINDSELNWTTTFLWEFQNFLEFYTSPTKNRNISKFILYTPNDDWSDGHTVIDEIEFEHDLIEELDIEDFMVRLLTNKYQIEKVLEESLHKYLSE